MYEVRAHDHFKKELVSLGKKYKSIPDDISDLIKELATNPLLGKPVWGNFRKVRMAIHSKNKGKRSGARIITLFTIKNNIVHLLSIYDKSVKDNLTPKEIERLVLFSNNELQK